ncbi:MULTISPECIES: proton-conducting transporter membrane subunit [unclassified Nitratiruptor]|uniref:proton-conducting transporter transmembrane domain-containing protein n=1 Tax=unclassified Nitratiruptor TaxID=2624044 RepID=UPI00191598C0|nr:MULTISPECIES: proton-conducting transporter membrane subunit [unclassified Nitratiruptor]BCD60022.1 hydrogenase-4 component B [Nitratiruptor sp. YY08-10]BCD63945.1 hydrogenase-4 component B [Nitratiruptor sp. YY08-14]
MFSFDTLSLLFLLFLILGIIPNIFYSFGYLSHIKRKKHYLVHYFAFILSMTGVIIANTPLLFLLFWELMSLTSWQLILTDAKDEKTTTAARFYFFMTHFGFVFILLFFLIVSNGNVSLPFDQLHPIAKQFAYPTLLFFMLIFGFLSKAGVIPLHVWLPYAHPAAPSAVSAMMSGVMLKIALYGFLRMILEILYPWSLEWGVTILILGALSSVIGVLYALAEHDIKALLANHSIENIGIILIGIGMGMIFDTLHLKLLSTFAFIAAIYHIFNHMSFKSLLFMSAGSVLHETGTKNIEKYGGLIKKMPITAFSFLLAAISISALPPTNGFLSEWMIFQSLLGSSNISDISLKISIPFTIFALALTGGLAIACFVKAFGITFLGLHRSTNAKYAEEVNALMRLGMILMGIVTLSLMLFAPFYIHLFNTSLTPFGWSDITQKIVPNFWNIHSIANNGGVVSPLILLVSLLIITALLVISAKKLGIQKRISHTWACGYNTTAKTQYSATGFAGPIRRFFVWLYKPQIHFHKTTIAGHTTKFKTALYDVHIKPLFETTLYDGTKRVLNIISYYLYRLAHFEQVRYGAIIFNLVLSVLFGYRIVAHQFNWSTFLVEFFILLVSIKILVIGDKK